MVCYEKVNVYSGVYFKVNSALKKKHKLRVYNLNWPCKTGPLRCITESVFISKVIRKRKNDLPTTSQNSVNDSHEATSSSNVLRI